MRALCAMIAEFGEARLGYLPEAANSVGAWLTGILPHRLPAGQVDSDPGLDAGRMLKDPLKAYLLFGVEPEYDSDDPASALRVMEAAEFVTLCTPFATETAKSYADVLLPISTFAETSGTFVNAEGRWQSFRGAADLPGESRPGWKVLRVLGNVCEIEGFEYMSTEQARDELKSQFNEDLEFDNRLQLNTTLAKPRADKGLMRASEVPIYAVDSLVRRSAPLQQTADAQPAAVHLNMEQAEALDLGDVDQVIVQQNGTQTTLPLILDDSIPMDCVWIPSGLDGTKVLGPGVGPVDLSKS
jgi:NADH-quinone oxidoreductase subunit G